MTPPDPSLKGAWYPGGFNPCTYQVNNPVSKFAFQVHNLHRYDAVTSLGLACRAKIHARIGQFLDGLSASS